MSRPGVARSPALFVCGFRMIPWSRGAASWPTSRQRWFESIRDHFRILGVWRIAHDPAKVGDQVRLLTRMLDAGARWQAAGCNPADVGSIPTGVSDGQL